MCRHTPETCEKPACDDDPEFCPGYQICAPVPNNAFSVLDITVIVLFTIDFLARLFLVTYMPAR